MLSNQTTPESFLPTGNAAATGLSPSGNEFYIQDIGRNKLRFFTKRPVEWIEFDKAGNRLATYTAYPNVLQLPVNNSYYSPSAKKVFIETNMNTGKVRRAELNKENFDLSPLDSLHTVEQVKAGAIKLSNEANKVDNISQLDFIDQLIFSITGTTSEGIKKIAKGALVVGGLVLLNNIVKKIK